MSMSMNTLHPSLVGPLYNTYNLYLRSLQKVMPVRKELFVNADTFAKVSNSIVFNAEYKKNSKTYFNRLMDRLEINPIAFSIKDVHQLNLLNASNASIEDSITDSIGWFIVSYSDYLESLNSAIQADIGNIEIPEDTVNSIKIPTMHDYYRMRNKEERIRNAQVGIALEHALFKCLKGAKEINYRNKQGDVAIDGCNIEIKTSKNKFMIIPSHRIEYKYNLMLVYAVMVKDGKYHYSLKQIYNKYLESFLVHKVLGQAIIPVQ